MKEALLPSWRNDATRDAIVTFLILVNHDDAEREHAYESMAGTCAADESITDTAARLGWTVASIRNDRSTVFAGS